MGRAAGENDRVVFRKNVLRRDVRADIHARAEGYAFLTHDGNSSLDDAFFQLHVGNAVHQQTAHAVASFKHRDGMSSVIELVGCRESRRTRADDRDLLAGSHLRRLRLRPAFRISSLHNGVFVCPHGYSIAFRAAGTRFFAKRGTHAAGKFRETVGQPQPVIRLLPCPSVDEIVPFGNEVAQRTAGNHPPDHHAGLAERHAARHAARRLFFLLRLGKRLVKFVEMRDTLAYGEGRRVLALIFQKSCRFSHSHPLLYCSRVN